MAPLLTHIRPFRLAALSCLTALILCLASCRGEEMIIPSEEEHVGTIGSSDPNLDGLYLLNEGNMGSNKCTLDFLDLGTGCYLRNIYPERNPGVAKELGDVGNDLGIYGSKLYIIVNCSHKVEVVDARSGVRIGQIDIPNCRYIRFHKGKAYVSSYVGPVAIGNDSPKGAVYEIDTLSLAINRTVTVGYQPEEMEIVDDLLYVANSGGYRPPEYDNTVSVVRLSDLRQIDRITVGRNPGRLRKDRYDRLWVTSRGDNTTGSGLLQMLAYDPKKGKMGVAKQFDIRISNMAIHNDLLLYFAPSTSGTGNSNSTYGVIDIVSGEKISDNFITDGTDKEITIPYGIAIMPESGNILLTDAKNYVSSGTLYCFSPEGKKLWSVRTGDIPAHMEFLTKSQP